MPTSATTFCKLCQAATQPRHTIAGITYYHCTACDFLQNYYLETQADAAAQRQDNDDRRATTWPAGDPDEMHRKGWEMLEQMTWPIAWWSRQAHRALYHLPGYKHLARIPAKHRLSTILDFGTGHGATVLELRQRDGLDIIGLDPFSPINNPAIERRSLKEVNFPTNTFSGIFAVETMEHIPNVLETFAEINRILKPGGIFIFQTRRLEDPNYQHLQDKWFYLEDPKTHVSIYSETALRHIAELTGWSKAEFRGTRLARFTK